MPAIPAVDQDCCIGCEACTQICPEVFRMEEEVHGEPARRTGGTARERGAEVGQPP